MWDMLKRFLVSLGLRSEASDEEAKAFAEKLTGEQRTAVDLLMARGGEGEGDVLEELLGDAMKGEDADEGLFNMGNSGH
jgi:Mn-dependent DtxR family transcriptional regulator